MIRLGTQTNPVNGLVIFHVISYQDCMLQLLKKQKPYTKLGPGTVLKAPLSQNLFVIICR